ncbi:MAG: DUF4384 domain-containing protein [Blastocatellia bacterium]
MQVLWFAVACVGLIFNTTVCAQDPAQEEDARRLWDSEFLKKRAEAKTPAPARKPMGYRRVAAKKPAPAKPNATDAKPAIEAVEGEMVGVTVWRLRATKTADAQESRLLLEEDEKSEWTLERVESETVFAPGDRVRLSIESPRNGYLYVIDREQYTDGTLSNPHLIFPTLRNRNGDNSVKAGKVIELPGKSAFRLSSLREDYAGEALTVIVTEQPLADVTVGERIVKLDPALVARWEKQWNASIERFELIGGAGKTYTKAEREAGQEGSRVLTQEDELPQTLYRVVAARSNPLLITVPLRMKK